MALEEKIALISQAIRVVGEDGPVEIQPIGPSTWPRRAFKRAIELIGNSAKWAVAGLVSLLVVVIYDAERNSGLVCKTGSEPEEMVCTPLVPGIDWAAFGRTYFILALTIGAVSFFAEAWLSGQQEATELGRQARINRLERQVSELESSVREPEGS